jgi:hypothetical protein
VNKSLALSRRAHAAAAAVVAAAAAEGRPPSLSELIIDPSWRDALAGDLARDSFRSLETVRRAPAAALAALAAGNVFPPKPHELTSAHTSAHARAARTRGAHCAHTHAHLR